MNESVNFTLSYINKTGEWRLSDYKGKVIVLTFWASWCPDCSVDLPKKEQLFQSMDPSKVELVSINVLGRERSREEAEKYANKFLSQPSLIDNGRDVYDLFHCEGVPTTIIIDQHGKVHQTFGDKSNFLDIVQSIGEVVE
ncbi:TlpA family protein disulfide reductase [Paraliobacillus ryukyuensis]|uniref:TlpA family protein disulfide reductase n=1 Tax=Paraliobacillus ryukyuensis TaxID=200904 RepID=UPI0009A6A4D8|nr:TlpA disulfide reductase family protein [Paraliobacillus ryukyuensis]